MTCGISDERIALPHALDASTVTAAGVPEQHGVELLCRVNAEHQYSRGSSPRHNLRLLSALEVTGACSSAAQFRAGRVDASAARPYFRQ